MELYCPSTRRQHKDLDIFVIDEEHTKRSRLTYELSYSGYYHCPTIHEGAFCSDEGLEIEIFYSDGSFPFVITSLMSRRDFLTDSVNVSVKLSKKKPELFGILSSAFKRSSEDEAVALTDSDMRITTESSEIRVASPRSLILMKARAYACRRSQYDSKDIISLIDTKYSGIENFLRTESEFMRTSNKRFSNYLRYVFNEDPLSNMLYLDNMKTRGESRFPLVERAVSSLPADELAAMAGLASCVLSAYYLLPVQEVYDNIHFSV